MTSGIQPWRRFGAVAALLFATGLLVHMQRYRDSVAVPPLARLPMEVGPWQGHDINIPQVALEVLGNGQFLLRNYRRDLGDPGFDLFVAYIPNQTSGNSIHSPRNCLPGSGWAPVDFRRVEIKKENGNRFWANEYIVEKASDRALVIYWYQSHNRATASEYWAKLYLFTDSIMMNRSDGGMIRIVTPIMPGEPNESARQRAGAFTNQIIPVIDRYFPR